MSTSPLGLHCLKIQLFIYTERQKKVYTSLNGNILLIFHGLMPVLRVFCTFNKVDNTSLL